MVKTITERLKKASYYPTAQTPEEVIRTREFFNPAFKEKEILEQGYTKVIYLKRREHYGNLRFYPECDFSRSLLNLISFKRKCFTENEVIELMDSPLMFYVEFIDYELTKNS